MPRLPKPTTIDFETKAIGPRPDYPPEPVSVSIKRWGRKPRFWAWGHKAGGNNCSKADAKRALEAVWRDPEGLLFQNAKFDTDVAEVHFDLPPPSWERTHDTLYLIYLEDPRLRDFGLKPAAEHFLDMPPEERDAVKDWILQKDHKAWIESYLGTDPETGKRITVKPSEFGRYIWYAPGDVVGPYADGDVIRTERLFDKLWRSIAQRGMLESYDRERRLMPHVLRSEREGQRVDLRRLKSDITMYEGVMAKIDERIRKKCKKPSLNVGSGKELGQALVDAGLADDGLMGYTANGSIQTNKAAIRDGVTDRETRALLAYRGPLHTCLSTFMRNWAATAERSGGLLFTNWNQVKHGDGKSKMGTSTGRLSSTPPFQNIPKEFEELLALMGVTKAQLAQIVGGLKLPKLPPLPLCRGYIVPYEKGDVLMDRDYSQQELRILGHYEDGVLKEAYLQNVWLDMHEHARQMIKELIGILYPRKPVKNTVFGIIYGEGAPGLAVRNNISVDESRRIVKAILSVFPGIQDIMDDMKERAKADEPIRTWGGREYYCEPDQYVEKFKRVMSFDYKLINLLVQGSAADCTKEAIIRWCDVKPAEDRFHMTVHDQTVGSTPKKRLPQAMELMREAMESVEFDIPILTEGSWSPTDWAHMRDYDKAGKVLYNGRSR